MKMQDNYDKHFKEVKNSFSLEQKKENISLDDIIEFLKGNNFEDNQNIDAGLIYQKNKDLSFIDSFFKSIISQIQEMQSKDNNKSDKFLFNTNKKILENNLNSIREIFKIYDLKEEKIFYFLLGTMIQYIYESKERKT
jgi:uncharacterized protein (UPF0305 family)